MKRFQARPALARRPGRCGPCSTSSLIRWPARIAARDLSNVDYVYVWADGIHVNVRLEEGKLCLLV
ncbi:MAG: hypothetical protein J2P17_22285, partial [Mycobacterium sp.]|nr:hypothetical protein [Mycobacterium sp.]